MLLHTGQWVSKHDQRKKYKAAGAMMKPTAGTAHKYDTEPWFFRTLISKM
jgi:hypothetical protein